MITLLSISIFLYSFHSLQIFVIQGLPRLAQGVVAANKRPPGHITWGRPISIDRTARLDVSAVPLAFLPPLPGCRCIPLQTSSDRRDCDTITTHPDAHIYAAPPTMAATDDNDVATKAPESDAQEISGIPGDSRPDQGAASMGVSFSSQGTTDPSTCTRLWVRTRWMDRRN